MAANSVTQEFLEFSRVKLVDEYWPRMKKCVESLTDEQVWWRPNEASNSIGNLLLHLNGNVYQWLVASFNQSEDGRDRPAEFAAQSGPPASELQQKLESPLQQVSGVLARLSDA